jgi:hypothetical protein
MVHELGHTLGLRHNKAQATEQPGTAGINFVTGTVADDPSSVMIPVNSGFLSAVSAITTLFALKTVQSERNDDPRAEFPCRAAQLYLDSEC